MATCPRCGVSSREDSTAITLSEAFVAKPLGTWSLSGRQLKTVATVKARLSCRCGWSALGYIEEDMFVLESVEDEGREMTDADDGQEKPGKPHWNYRLVRLNEEDVGICEVYYNADGVPKGYIEKTTVGGTGGEEIENTLHRMFEALNKPVLTIRKGADGFVDELTDTGQLLQR